MPAAISKLVLLSLLAGCDSAPAAEASREMQVNSLKHVETQGLAEGIIDSVNRAKARVHAARAQAPGCAPLARDV